MKPFITFFTLTFGAIFCLAQQPQPQQPAQTQNSNIREMNNRLEQFASEQKAASGSKTEDYRIGPEDLIEVSVFEVPEMSRTVRVSASGEISFPLIGTMKVAGLSPMQLEHQLADALRKTYLKDPQVSIFLREYKSDPVIVMGAVRMAGPYQIQTKKSLAEVLAMAQGFADGPLRFPGKSIIITRKRHTSGEDTAANPVPGGASASNSDSPEILEVPIKELLQSGDPKWNVPIYPGDIVKVVPAGSVYVAGAVNRPGGFPLTDYDRMSAIQALAMAGGKMRTASSKNASIIHTDGVQHSERKIDLGRILKGQDPDTSLGPNDILFIPGSVGKESALRAIEASIQIGSGILIWNRP